MSNGRTSRDTVVERTTELEAAIDVCFAAVNSPETAPLIDPSVRSWQPDTDPIGIGTRFTIKARLGVLPIAGQSEVVEWDPPRTAVYRSVRPVWPFRMRAEHRFVPGVLGAGAGERTTYTWSITFTETSVIGRLLIALVARLFDGALDRQAEALAAFVRA